MSGLLEKISLTFNTYSKAYNFINRQNRPGEIRKAQDKKIRRLIKYSYDNIKYYRELFDRHHIKPEDIQTVSDLTKVPFLTKRELREQFWDFLPKELPSCRVSRTSGSTGIPVCILSDINSRINNSAAVIRYRKQLGVNCIGKDILTPQKTAAEQRKQPHWTFLQGIHKTFYVNPYTNKDDEIEYAIGIIKRLHKPVIIGITSAIRALAWRIHDHILPPLKAAAVLTTGESLSSQARKLMEDTFNVKVTDIYACNEAGDIAWQCRKGQFYHINADNCIVEILKDGQPAREGDMGEVVITNLNRYSMPFIRYKNGDLARLGSAQCPCGCKLPVISEIIGRTGEDIYLPNGKMIPWNQLKGLMNHPCIRQFQLVQNKDSSLTVKFIAEEKYDIEQIKKLLTSRLSSLLGDSIRIEFLLVQKIEPAPSGKSKLVISNYDNSRQISSSS